MKLSGTPTSKDYPDIAFPIAIPIMLTATNNIGNSKSTAYDYLYVFKSSNYSYLSIVNQGPPAFTSTLKTDFTVYTSEVKAYQNIHFTRLRRRRQL